MNLPRTLCLAALLSTLIGLASCGGGGSDQERSIYPTSGTYGWIVKPGAGGDRLSLIHPSQPDTEYAITQSSDGPRWWLIVSSGTVNASTQQVTDVRAHTIVYDAGQSVRSVSLEAHGAAPVSKPPSSGLAESCNNLGVVGNDYTNPLNSRLIVPRRSRGGINCFNESDNPDDVYEGLLELRFSASGELVSTVLSTTPADPIPVGVLRDTATLAPRAWLYRDRVVLWADGTTIPLSPPGTTDTQIVLASTDRQALVQRPGGLSVLDFPSGSTLIETPLNPAVTAGFGPFYRGTFIFDDDAYYLGASSFDPSTRSDVWKVLKITRSSPVASVLVSGTDSISELRLGSNALYAISLTIPGMAGGGPRATHRNLIRISKTDGSVQKTAYPIGITPTIHPGAAGVHMLELEDQNSFSLLPAGERRVLQFIDEDNNTLYTADQGYGVGAHEDTNTVNFGRSVHAERFFFAANNAQDFYAATLTVYDTRTRQATALGPLPSTADYADTYAEGVEPDGILAPGPQSFGAGVAARSVVGWGFFIASNDNKVFSFDISKPNSLRYTTTVR